MKKKLAFLLCMTLTLCSTSGAVLATESEQDADPASALISAADMPPSVSAYKDCGRHIERPARCALQHLF